MAEPQQIGGAPPNIPLVPSTFTSPQSSPPALLNTPPTFSTPISPPSSNRGQGENFAALHTVIISLITTVIYEEGELKLGRESAPHRW